jgi:uncharacterized protein YlaI
MLTRQKYCVLCEFRDRIDGKTICKNMNNDPVSYAMQACERLEPFDKLKEMTGNGKTDRRDGTIREGK